MNRRQLLTAPLVLMAGAPAVPAQAAPQGLAPAKPKPSGRVIIFADGSFAAGRLTAAEREVWRQQLELALQDPDHTLITSHRVTCYSAALRGRVVSVPGASDGELRTVRHQLNRYLVQEVHA